jgi:hypothetical protein
MRLVDFLVSLLLFVGSFLVFVFSPVRSLGETQFTMMFSYNLAHHRSFALDRNDLGIPEHLEMIGNTAKVKSLALEVVNNRVYKYAPPGSSVLSLPFVITAGWFQLKPINDAGIYDPARELLLSSILAALLMAVFAVECFQFCRLLLPLTSSLAITLASIFGTQIWSTASRVVEPDSWSVVLLMLALYLLAASELDKQRFRPVLLGTILSWCYFVHPTSAISIVAITVYVLLYRRSVFKHFVLTGMAWGLVLIAYSWFNFRQLLPNYFQATRLGFETFWEALAGNLVSPSRGLFIYVPVLIVIAFVLVRRQKSLVLPRLVITGALVMLVHLLVISGFSHWWAGHSYGPRYWTSLVPWFVLFSACSVKALHEWMDEKRRALIPKLQIALVVTFALAGILIHSRGALSQETRRWNAKPYDIDLRAGRLWNWRYPQFLAGLINPPLPAGMYPAITLNEPVDLTSETADQFLWYGWSTAEPGIRWTEEKRAALVFALEKSEDLILVIRAAPFVVRGVKDSQRLSVKLNGEQLQSTTLTEGQATDLTFILPHQRLARENVMLFELPDAESPIRLGLSDDQRLLGLAGQWLELRSTSEKH